MEFTLPYGTASLAASIDWGRCIGILDVGGAAALPQPERAVRDALRHPIGLGRGLNETVHPGETVAIVVSDAFRKTGAHLFMPVLLDVLNAAGVPDASVTAVFATGAHRPPTKEEQREILGDNAYRRLQDRLFLHNPDDDANLVFLGVTRRGTPVRLNRRVVNSDRIIATGACVLHYFGGFGGGRKSIVPGIAGRDTIAHNHAMNLHPVEGRLNPAVRIGVMDGNPVAEDMLEGARLANVDFVLNTVLNRDGKIAGVFAGEMEAAHRAAAEYARSLYVVPIEEQADVVIAAAGNTRNFVQTHKALYNAYQAMKPGGRIVLAAHCEEGLGSVTFEDWLRLGAPADIIAGLRRQSEINGQTALSTVHKGPSTLLVTALPDEAVALLKARKAATLEQALATARSELAASGVEDPTYYIMPSAAYSVPVREKPAGSAGSVGSD